MCIIRRIGASEETSDWELKDWGTFPTSYPKRDPYTRDQESQSGTSVNHHVERTSADVEPVILDRVELARNSGLDVLDVFGEFELGALFEVVGVRPDEGGAANIADSEGRGHLGR